MMLIVSVLILILIISSGLVFYLVKRNKLKRELLKAYKNQLNNKQEFVTQNYHIKLKKLEFYRQISVKIQQVMNG